MKIFLILFLPIEERMIFLRASPSGRSALRKKNVLGLEKNQHLTRSTHSGFKVLGALGDSARCSARLTHIALALQTTMLDMWFAYSGSGNVACFDR
jgi:hypothetical protein